MREKARENQWLAIATLDGAKTFKEEETITNEDHQGLAKEGNQKHDG